MISRVFSWMKNVVLDDLPHHPPPEIRHVGLFEGRSSWLKLALDLIPFSKLSACTIIRLPSDSHFYSRFCFLTVHLTCLAAAGQKAARLIHRTLRKQLTNPLYKWFCHLHSTKSRAPGCNELDHERGRPWSKVMSARRERYSANLQENIPQSEELFCCGMSFITTICGEEETFWIHFSDNMTRFTQKQTWKPSVEYSSCFLSRCSFLRYSHRASRHARLLPPMLS